MALQHGVNGAVGTVGNCSITLLQILQEPHLAGLLELLESTARTEEEGR